MPALYTQRGNSMLIALGGILVLIILIGLFLNHRSAQKIQQLSSANQAAASHGHTAAQGISQVITDPAQADHVDPDKMDKNIQHMNQYNQELMLYGNRQNELIREWGGLQQKAYGQDRLAIRYTLDKMVQVYHQLDKLPTPECKLKEKYQWMREMQESIDQLNAGDSGSIVSFTPVNTPHVEAYDCFASMPPTPK